MKPLPRAPRRILTPAYKFRQASALTQRGQQMEHLIHGIRGRTKMEKITSLCKKISKIPIYFATDAQIQKLYAKRGAEQILKDNAILIHSMPHAVRGCVDYTHLFVGAMRGMGISAKFVRWNTHSVPKFKIGNDYYYIDSYVRVDFDKPPKVKFTIKKIDEKQKAMIKNSIQRGEYWEGLDAKNIGLDYKNYLRPSKAESRIGRI